MPSTPYAYYTTSSEAQPEILATSLYSGYRDVTRLALIEGLWQHWPFVYASMIQAYAGR